MKHLIETTGLSSLGFAEYDRLILDSTKNEIVYRGGVKYEYVDLGLPSRLKWAKCNVGAEKETDYGDYFQWGETTSDTVYDWTTYKYCKSSETTMTKYNTSTSYGENPDNITTLKPEDDAATQIMGGNWRMPTATEFQELYDNTTNEWVEDYNGSGVNGRKFTSETDTSKYIFIPASGYAHSERVYDRGLCCNSWSSSLSPSSSNCGVNLYFTSKRIEPQDYGYRRYFGFCVRGVFK